MTMLLIRNNFRTITNDEGESVLNEDFTQIIKEFKNWCVSQVDLKKLFFGVKNMHELIVPTEVKISK